MPMQPRSSTGIFSRPLLMYDILAIWLMISPTPSRMKSANMKSITGRVPVMAAPALRPTKPRSQMGVSHSRSGPKRSYSPAVVLKLPPRLPMPSPITKMRGLAAISSESASSVAFMNVSSRMGSPVIHVRGRGRWVGPGAAFGELAGVYHRGADLLVDRPQLRFSCETLLQQYVLQPQDRVARLPGFDRFAGAVGEVAH